MRLPRSTLQNSWCWISLSLQQCHTMFMSVTIPTLPNFPRISPIPQNSSDCSRIFTFPWFYQFSLAQSRLLPTLPIHSETVHAHSRSPRCMARLFPKCRCPHRSDALTPSRAQDRAQLPAPPRASSRPRQVLRRALRLHHYPDVSRPVQARHCALHSLHLLLPDPASVE